MAVYLTGGSGRLGREVLKLVDAVPLVRRKSGLAGELECDFSPASLRGRLSDADALIHLAGSMKFWDRKELWGSNHLLTRKLVDACPEECRLFLAGSVSVYGKEPAEIPADEDTPANPDTEYAKSKLAAEGEAKRMENHCIFRISTIYGPGYPDYCSVFRMLQKGKMRILGDGGNRLPFVHVEDVAEGISRAFARGASGTYVLSGEPLTQKRTYEVAAEALGCPPPSRHVSPSVAIAYASAEELLAKITGSRPMFTSEHMRILSSDRAFDFSRALHDFNFFPRPLEKGIREMAADYLRRRKE